MYHLIKWNHIRNEILVVLEMKLPLFIYAVTCQIQECIKSDSSLDAFKENSLILDKWSV